MSSTSPREPARRTSTSGSTAPAMRVAVWATRLSWLAFGLVGTQVFGSALDDRSAPVQVVAGAGLWIAWGAALVAMLAPSTVGLTVSRLIVGASLPLVVLAGLNGADTWSVFVAGSLAVVGTLAAFSGEYGEMSVQSSAYGAERRLPLRPPVALVAPMILAWAVLLAAATSGPLLLASGQWVVGGAISAAAVVLMVVVGPRFHRLSRRWLVVVPAGLVVHDQVVLAETVMLRRPQVVHVGLAAADTTALDLTGVTWGTALEVTLGQPEPVVPALTAADQRAGTTAPAATSTERFLVAPTRPGRAMEAMALGRLPVG